MRRLRSTIPALKRQIYVNWGGSGPSPAAVLKEVDRVLRREAKLGAFHSRMKRETEASKAALRASVADLLGARAEEIALTDNTTAGINIATAGLDWKAGDEVLVTDLEHPGGYVPWLLWRLRRGIRVRLLHTGSSDTELLDNLERALGPRTRAVCASHIACLTGRLLPIARMGRLCRKSGALLVVDGAQSVGQTDVDVKKLNADVYTVSGQKWLMGPMGTGAVYVRRALRDRVMPAVTGVRSARKKRLETLTFLPRSDAARYEAGTISPALFSGLNTAAGICRRMGPENIKTRIAALAGRLLEKLRESRDVEVLSPPGPAQSGLVAFRVNGIGGEEGVEHLLQKDRIVLRTMPTEPPSLRASIHYVNTEEEVERIGRAVLSLARRAKTRGKRRSGGTSA